MEPNGIAESGATAGDPSGAGNQEPENKASSQTPEGSEKTVNWNDHKRLLDDAMKIKKRNAELEARYAEEAKRAKALEEQKLLSEKKEGELLAIRTKELEETRSRLDALHTALRDKAKEDAVLLAARKAGIRPEAEEDLLRLSLDEVGVEETSYGKLIVHGAEDFVRREVVEKKSHWLVPKQSPYVNAGGGRSQSVPVDNELTPEYMIKLEKTDPAKHRAIWPKFVAARMELKRRQAIGG